MAAEIYPSGLQYYLRSISGFQRTNIQVFPTNRDTASAGQVVQFTLPSNCLVDLNTLRLLCNIRLKQGVQPTAWSARKLSEMESGNHPCDAALPRDFGSLISRLEVSVNGQIVSQGMNHYGQLYALLSQAKRGFEKHACRGTYQGGGNANSHRPNVQLGAYQKAGGSSGADGSIAKPFPDTVVPCCITEFLGFIGSVRPQIIDTSSLGDVVIRITLQPNDIVSPQLCPDLTAATGSTVAAGTYTAAVERTWTQRPGYSLSDVHMQIDTIAIQDGTYYSLLAARLVSGVPLELPFKQYMSFEKVCSTWSNSQRFSLATQSLDKVHVACKPKGYAGTTNRCALDIASGSIVASGAATAEDPDKCRQQIHEAQPLYAGQALIDGQVPYLATCCLGPRQYGLKPGASTKDRGLNDMPVNSSVSGDTSAPRKANTMFIGDNGITGIQMSVNNVYCPTYVVKPLGDAVLMNLPGSTGQGKYTAPTNLTDAGQIDAFRCSDEFLQQTRKAWNTDNDERCTDILDSSAIVSAPPTNVSGFPECGPGSVYARSRFLYTYTFEHSPSYDEKESRWISGLNTAGNSATCQLMLEGKNECGAGDYFNAKTVYAPATDTVAGSYTEEEVRGSTGHIQMIFPEMTSVLRISANKMIEVIQ